MKRLAIGLGLALLVACGGGGGSDSAPAPTPSPTAAPSNLIVPTNGIYLGAFVNTSGTAVAQTSDLSAFETQVGRKMALTEHYYGFYDVFPTAAEQFDLSEGRVPIESWGCATSNAQIAAGAADAAIATRAAALRKFGHPVFVRYMWEMNNVETAQYRTQCYDPATDQPNGVFSPTEFIAAWRHMHAIFVQQGATNVIWLWNPAGQTNFGPYYPGADVVDWVGVDKYDYGTAAFDATYQSDYQLLTAYGKPIAIGETGALAAQQPVFFASAVSDLQSQFPQVKAWVYFDAVGANDDWRIVGSGIPAFATMGSSPYLSAMPPL